MSLLIAVLSISLLHTVMPNHWLPFAMMWKAEKWTKKKTLSICAIASLGHVAVTILLAMLVVWLGHEVFKRVESFAESLAGWVLITFGILYILFSFLRSRHEHRKIEESRGKVAVYGLILMLTLSPCEAILPVFFASSPIGWNLIIILSIIFAISTFAGMLTMTYLAMVRLEKVRFSISEKHEKLISGSVVIILGIALLFIPHGELLLKIGVPLSSILRESWRIMLEASPYILFGLFVSGIIEAFISKERIAKHLGPNKFKSVFYATLFGIPLPLCSCAVVPTAISLRKQGASKGATMAFLISTPETGVDSISITYALMDPIMTFFRPITAFITATVAGIMENIFLTKEENILPLEKLEVHEEEVGVPESVGHGFLARIRYGMKYAFVGITDDIATWLVIGIVAAGAITYFIPEAFISDYFGGGWKAMFMMLIIGIPLYICASASTPIAAALIAKGVSPGAALVFLMAGPATNTATIIMVTKFLGKKSAIIYLLSISVCTLFMGFVLDHLYSFLSINPKAVIGKAGEIVPHSIEIASAIALILLMALVKTNILKERP